MTTDLSLYTVDLTAQQAEVFKELALSKDNYKLLSGLAGSGKSFLVARYLKYLLDSQSGLIGMSATTNKAVKVLRAGATIQSNRVSYKTLHSFMGLKENISPKGEISFIADKMAPKSINDLKYLIIDESSMLNDELFGELSLYVKKGLKVIFVGDEAQISPVGLADAIPFNAEQREKIGIELFELTEIVRQAKGNPIIALSNAVRNRPRFSGTTDQLVAEKLSDIPLLVNGNEGVEFVDDLDLESIFTKLFCCKEFDEDADYAKVLVWTNKARAAINKYIRQLKFGSDVDSIVVGDKLIADSPILKENVIGEEVVIFTTNDEFEVIDAKVVQRKVNGVLFNVYDTKVQYVDIVTGDTKVETIPILHESSKELYTDTLKAFKEIAIKDKVTPKQSWVAYYAFMRSFADVSYNYSITGHKCLPLSSNIKTTKGMQAIGDINVGDLVISGAGNVKKVSNVFISGKKDKYIIKTRRGRVFESSAEHRFLVGSGEYKEASLIRPGDHLCLYRNNYTHNFIFDLDYWGYGYLVGNGCYNYTSNRVDITLLKDSNMLPMVENFLGRYGSKVYTYLKKNNKAITLSTECKEFREHLASIGITRNKSYNKLPPILPNINAKANYIRGLMDSDGSVCYDRACIRFVNTSKAVIDNLQVILQDFGIISSIHVRISPNPKWADAYTLSISGLDAVRYLNSIGFSCDYKQVLLEKVCKSIKGKTNLDYIPDYLGVKEELKKELKLLRSGGIKGKGIYSTAEGKRLAHFIKTDNLAYTQARSLIDYILANGGSISTNTRNILDNWYYYDEVVASYNTGEQVDMVDIEVEDDNSFLYNGTIVHNCQGSTYQNTVVIEYDINRNLNITERNKIKYTALTRASKKCYIVV